MSEEEKKAGNIEGKIREEKKPLDETVFKAKKDKVGEAEELKKNSKLKRKMLVFGNSAKVIGKTTSELEEKKPPDLSKLDHNAKTEIGEDLMEMKKKKLLVFGINYKVIAETKSELNEKKLPDLSKLNMFCKFAKIESKGVTKACITEACVTEARITKACITEACVTEACIITQSEGDTNELRDLIELKKKKPPDLSKLNHKAKAEIGEDRMELKKNKLLVFGIDYKVTIETKSELKEKKLPDLSKLNMFGMFAKTDSKGVTKACVNEACVTEACIGT